MMSLFSKIIGGSKNDNLTLFFTHSELEIKIQIT